MGNSLRSQEETSQRTAEPNRDERHSGDPALHSPLVKPSTGPGNVETQTPHTGSPLKVRHISLDLYNCTTRPVQQDGIKSPFPNPEKIKIDIPKMAWDNHTNQGSIVYFLIKTHCTVQVLVFTFRP